MGLHVFDVIMQWFSIHLDIEMISVILYLFFFNAFFMSHSGHGLNAKCVFFMGGFRENVVHSKVSMVIMIVFLFRNQISFN